MEELRFSIITLSDRASAGIYEDKSGSILKGLINSSKLFNGVVIEYKVIPDEYQTLKNLLIHLCDSGNSDVVITNGGTGFGPRDITPEVTELIIDKRAPGLEMAIMQRSLQATRYAVLSRLVCGKRKLTWVINMPGSHKAVKECWEVVEPIILHAVNVLKNHKESVACTHEELIDEGGDALRSKVETTSVAMRPRKSPFPLLTVEQATKTVLDQIGSIEKTIVKIDTFDSLGFVLATDIIAPEDHPPFPASIKDGYAVVSSDGIGRRLVVASLNAGADKTIGIKSGSCARISTGAVLPQGADAVVQVEDTELVSEKDGSEIEIEIKVAPKVGLDIRPPGSDIRKGSMILPKGQIIHSSEIGLLLSMGLLQIPVHSKPKVAVMSTGNEVVDPICKHLEVGKIRDSNRALIRLLLKEHGFDSFDLGIAPDIPDVLLANLCNAFDKADILVTSGGVSMGEKDLLKQVLVADLNFEVLFGRVFMKPGKPTAFCKGKYKGVDKFIFGLPGNPVSCWVTSQLYVLPAIRLVAGFQNVSAPLIKVEIEESLKLDTRPEYHRGVLTNRTSVANLPLALSTGSNQMSSRLLSSAGANILLLLPPKTDDCNSTKPGDVIDALLIGHQN